MRSLIVRVDGIKTTTTFEGSKEDYLHAVEGLTFAALNSGVMSIDELQEALDRGADAYYKPTVWDKFRTEAGWMAMIGMAALGGGYTVAWIIQRLVGG